MSRSIGIFDSGIGGLSILKSLARKAVNENYISLADNKNCPYGNKSEIEISKLSIKNCEKLIKLNCKMIIVACNTATTNSINILRKQFDVPIIGIEPGIKPAINYLMGMKCKKIILGCTELPIAIFAFKSFKNIKSSKIFLDPNLILAESAMAKHKN